LTYHYDYRGSTVTITDGAAAVKERIEYSTYGRITYRTGNTDTSFLYNGRYGVMTDANGLYYMRARYYSSYLRRFINTDPAGFAGGMNWYAYADGNPISYLDPFGLGKAEPTRGYWSFFFSDLRENWADNVTDFIGGGLESAASMTAMSPALWLDPVFRNEAGEQVTGLVNAVKDPGTFADNFLQSLTTSEGIGALTFGIESGLALGSIGSLGTTAESVTVSGIQEGATIYRVFGGESRALGRSWTTVAPDAVSDFRAAAGLFEANTGQYVITAELKSLQGFSLRQSLPGPTTPLGAIQIPELLFKNPPVPGVNIKITGGGGWRP
jgi:RHS repeat-associated protein